MTLQISLIHDVVRVVLMTTALVLQVLVSEMLKGFRIKGKIAHVVRAPDWYAKPQFHPLWLHGIHHMTTTQTTAIA